MDSSPNLSRQVGMREKKERVASDTPLRSDVLDKAGQASSNLSIRIKRKRLLEHHHVLANRARDRQVVVGSTHVSVHLPGDSRALREGDNVAGHMTANVQRLAENDDVPVHRP